MRKKKSDHEQTKNSTEVTIYNRLAVLRAKRGISRQEIADVLGVNYQTIGYIDAENTILA